MGTAKEHKAKASHNLAFLETISDQFPDWLETAVFYVAVQLIEQLLADRGIHSSDHHRRNTSVRTDFPQIHRSYKALYNASLVARYDPLSGVLPVADVRNVLIGRNLMHIISYTASHSKTA